MLSCIKNLKPIKYANLFLRMNSNSSLGAEIELRKINEIACIVLNRPKQLNSLNLPMVKLMKQYLEECENDKQIKAVLVKGAGETAFCAGGDVKTIRELCLKGEKNQAMEFFKEEYKLNYQISTYKKPYIALINGVTMGGGVGISVHGKYRIATEKTLFAMPETAIGFFADVGGTHFLSRLKDHIGLYLVLTGNRLKGQDVKRTGIATHFMNSSKLPNFENKLYESNNLSAQSIDNIINEFNERVEGEYDSHHISQIFNASSLEEIIENLEKENNDWSKQQLKFMSKMSPTSLKVAVKQLSLGLNKSLKECLEMEYQLGLRFAERSDFMEGVRVVLVDRGDKPKWNPQSYKEINESAVDWFFKPLPDDDKLNLPQ